MLAKVWQLPNVLDITFRVLMHRVMLKVPGIFIHVFLKVGNLGISGMTFWMS